MVELARANAAQAGAVNAAFLHGSIEEIPLPDGWVDVVISNCVINLSACKPRALAEAFRVLGRAAGWRSATSSRRRPPTRSGERPPRSVTGASPAR